MIERLKESWEEFRASEPGGYRFQTRYSNHRKRRERGEASRCTANSSTLGRTRAHRRGPRLPAHARPQLHHHRCIIIVVGLSMLAGEPLILARLFDRVEVGLRRVRRWIKALWVGYPKTARALIVLAIPACMAALAHLIF